MKAGVIGAGAWGTALAQLLAADGQAVRLWALEAEVVDAVNGSQENPLYLPGIPLSPSIAATGAMADMADCDLLLVVSPAQYLRSVVAQAPAGVPLLLCSKGIEAGTSLLMSEVAQQAQPRSPIAVL
ncbi:MAG: 2-dehydropantoate 2-reductase N-terminal domain-containing protein, partial [Alphaproteobacteria bacterium]